MSVASPSHAAFPGSQAGRHPRLHFRGLLRLHSNYGPLDRSTAQGGLCHRASIHPVTRTNRLPATRSNRQLSGWVLPPLVIRAFWAHHDIGAHEFAERGMGIMASRRQLLGVSGELPEGSEQAGVDDKGSAVTRDHSATSPSGSSSVIRTPASMRMASAKDRPLSRARTSASADCCLASSRRSRSTSTY